MSEDDEAAVDGDRINDDNDDDDDECAADRRLCPLNPSVSLIMFDTHINHNHNESGSTNDCQKVRLAHQDPLPMGNDQRPRYAFSVR